MNRYFHRFVTLTIFSCCLSFVFAQNKDIDKGKEVLKKAFEQKDAAKKNEMIQKSIELFTKGGLKKEMNLIIGDEFLEHNDLTQASSYYNRCDKGEKANGLERVAQAYQDQAFGDAKNEAKLLRSAMSFYTKSGKAKDGAKSIGDKYFEKGEQFYPSAIDYYFMAQDSAAVEKVADTYVAKGGEAAFKSIDILKRIGSKSALEKAGNICYDRKQFDRAYECYSNGDITAGLEKIADKYNEVGRTTEAGNIYVKIAENYMKTANTDAVEKLGTDNVKAMNFSLASRIYDKAGNMNKSKKYLAYNKFMELDLDSAKMLLTEVGELDLVKAIETNMKHLDNIKNNVMVLNDFVQNQPFVTMESDPETGKQRPAVKDENILIEYYKGIKDAIVETFHGISKSTLAISNPELKKMLIKHFQQYPAGTKVLDPTTFAVRLQKSTAQVKDVYLH